MLGPTIFGSDNLKLSVLELLLALLLEQLLAHLLDLHFWALKTVGATNGPKVPPTEGPKFIPTTTFLDCRSLEMLVLQMGQKCSQQKGQNSSQHRHFYNVGSQNLSAQRFCPTNWGKGVLTQLQSDFVLGKAILKSDWPSV